MPQRNLKHLCYSRGTIDKIALVHDTQSDKLVLSLFTIWFPYYVIILKGDLENIIERKENKSRIEP